jgi:hypothetical protein
MFKKSIFFILILLAFSLSQAQVPQVINYQGMLTDAGGTALNGSFVIEFKIYDAPTAGTALWTETQTVAVTAGLFDVLLGSVTPIPYTVFDGSDKYLSLKVGADPEMTPRKRLVSVGYALRAYNADKVDGLDAAAFVQTGQANSVTTAMIQDNAVTAAKIAPNVVSSLDGVSNDGGNIDLIAGSNVTITPDDANNTITIAATGGAAGDNLGNHTATQNIKLNSHWLSGDGGNEGVFVNNEGNVGIGTTVPGAKLDINAGSDTLTHLAINGLHGRPTLEILRDAQNWGKVAMRLFVDGSSTGIINVTNKNSGAAVGLKIQTNSIERFMINNAGNVGIGTISPTQKLDVAGTVQMTGFKMPTGAANNYVLTSDANGVGTWKQSGTGGWTISGNNMYSAVSGNVGIGINNPAGKLDVSHNGSTHALVVDAQGRVGIGDIEPAIGNSQLYLSITSGAEGALFHINNTSNSQTALRCLTNGTGDAFKAQHSGSSGNIARFESGGQPRMVIGVNGNVGIGTQNPTAKLHLENSEFKLAGTSALINFESTDFDANGRDMVRFGGEYMTITGKYGYRGIAVIGDKFAIWRRTLGPASDVAAFVVAANGNIGIGTTVPDRILTVKQGGGRSIADGWDVYSSRRWKTNIQPINSALEKVKRLTGVTFDWKENGKHDLGLIAEDVGQVIPEVVAFEENGVDAQSVDYARLVALLIQGMKEQQATIDQLTKRITDLEKNNR